MSGSGEKHAPAEQTRSRPVLRTLLLGLGNDLLTDDAIGLRVAARVRDQLKTQPEVAVRLSSEMGLALLDEIVGFDQLVIVDAVRTENAPPGHIHELDGDDLSAFPAISPHFLGVGEVLALGRQLGMEVPERVKIFAIEVRDTVTLSTKMTKELEEALPAAVERVGDYLRAHI